MASATGTGKTRLALAAMSAADAPDVHVVVAVPSLVLQQQWLDVFRMQLRLGPSLLGTVGGEGAEFRYTNRVVVVVLESARRHLHDIRQGWHQQGKKVLLIVDECHWAGSAGSAVLFSEPYDYTLGLSATPERSDHGFETVLVPGLGPVIYRYTLRAALDDAVLADLLSVCVIVPLPPEDRHHYERLTDQIGRLTNQIGASRPIDQGYDGAWVQALATSGASAADGKRLLGLLRRRRASLAGSVSKLDALGVLAGTRLLDARQFLVFNEFIDQAELAADLLRRSGRIVALDHSKLRPDVRRAAHARFAAGAAEALVAVRTVDEGIDVPDASVAVILSGTSTERQRVQRLGRVLRPSGERALSFTFLASGTVEETIADQDGELVGLERTLRVDVEGLADLSL